MRRSTALQRDVLAHIQGKRGSAQVRLFARLLAIFAIVLVFRVASFLRNIEGVAEVFLEEVLGDGHRNREQVSVLVCLLAWGFGSNLRRRWSPKGLLSSLSPAAIPPSPRRTPSPQIPRRCRDWPWPPCVPSTPSVSRTLPSLLTSQSRLSTFAVLRI